MCVGEATPFCSTLKGHQHNDTYTESLILFFKLSWEGDILEMEGVPGVGCDQRETGLSLRPC